MTSDTQTKQKAKKTLKEIEASINKGLLLFMISFFDFGASFIYDIPQSLSKAFCEDPTLKICEGDSSLMYSAYSLPNLVAVLIGGFILHKKGHRFCLVLYSAFVFVGMVVLMLGALYFKSFNIMLLGRLFEGVGAENLMITQYFATYFWFRKKGLAFALGCNQSMSFLASIIAFYLFPYLYIRLGELHTPIFVATAGPFVSLLCILVYIRLTKGIDERNYVNASGKENALENRTQREISQLTGQDSQYKEFSKEINENTDSLIPQAEEHNEADGDDQPIITKSRKTSQSQNNQLEDQKSQNGENGEIQQKHIGNLKLEDLGRFSFIFWVICVFMTTTNPAYFQFINQLNDMIQKKFHVDYNLASQLSMLVPATLMIFVPISSNFADRFGNKSWYFLASSIWGIGAFFILNWVQGTQIVAVPILMNIGIFYSIFSAVIWSGGAQACPPDLVDIGLAIMNTFQSIATFIYPILFVWLGLTTPQKLFPVLIGMILVGLAASVVLLGSKGKRILVPYA